MKRREIFVSLIMRVRDAEAFLEAALERAVGVMEQNFDYYEIVVVDDASVDRTLEIVQAIQKRARNIQLYRLARRKGDNIAIIAGLDHAVGDMAVVLDPWLDPPEAIPSMVDLAIGGASIVYALPRERLESSSLRNRLTNQFLHGLARLNEVDVPLAISSYRLFSRSVLNFILEPADRHRTLMIAPAMSGFPYATIEYDRLVRDADNPRPGRRASLWKALDLTFSSSVRPLRIVTTLALGICGLTFLYAVYVILTVMLKEDVASGWASLSLQVSGLFCLVCLLLAVLGEYLLQVLEVTTRRPLYTISRQAHSSLVDYAPRLNVVATGAVPPTRASGPNAVHANQPGISAPRPGPLQAAADQAVDNSH